jgi:hypothetical protein
MSHGSAISLTCERTGSCTVASKTWNTVRNHLPRAQGWRRGQNEHHRRACAAPSSAARPLPAATAGGGTGPSCCRSRCRRPGGGSRPRCRSRESTASAPIPALGGVVGHHVHDHLQPGGVQRTDHQAKLVHLAPAVARGRVLVVRSEIPDRLIAPVVAQAARHQLLVVHERVHREQLHRGHAKPLQVRDRRRMR